MKKFITLLSVALLLLSCQGTEGPMGPQGIGTNWKVIKINVSQNNWKEYLDKDGLNRYYSCHVNIPEITNTVYNDGNISMYYEINGMQQLLPYVRHYQNTAGDFWTRTVDYDYSVGGLNLYVTNSDFAVDIPEAMDFRIVITW